MSALKTKLLWPLVLACGCTGQTMVEMTSENPLPVDPRPVDPNYTLGTTAKVPSQGDRTLFFYYGPMKPMPGESMLYSIASFTGHSFGNFDFTAPDPAARAFADAGNAAGTFYRHCGLFGGCMEHRVPLGRTSFIGTAFVLELERAAAEACGDKAAFGMFPGNAAPGPTTLAIDVIRHHYKKAFAEDPSDADLAASMAYFADHLAVPETTGMTPLESAGRGHCRALVTSNRFLYY